MDKNDNDPESLRTENARLKNSLKENETIVQLLQKQLDQTNQTRDRLISILSHDLRSPMTSLLGMLNLIGNGQVSHQELIVISSNIRNNVQAVLNLIDDLLNWTLQKQVHEYSLDIVNLNLLIQDAFSVYSLAAINKQINLENQCQEGIFLKINYNMLRFVIRNLISNALKFSPRGSKIIVSSIYCKNHVCIAVADQGIGMSPEKISELFKDINKSHPGTENEKGTGLGLFICREYMDLINGKLEVKSKPNQGSTFTVKIPLSYKLDLENLTKDTP
ncbi:MAG: sensor histidine kinase [Candidatus Cyclobacteriaceae bacterium M3_2C_046]